MRYLPYFLIVLVVILAIFSVLFWLKPDSTSSLIALEREMSEKKLKEKGMKAEFLQELKSEGIDLRFLKIELDEMETLLPNAKARLEALQVEKDRIVRRLRAQSLDPRILKLILDEIELYWDAPGFEEQDQDARGLLSEEEWEMVEQWFLARDRYKREKEDLEAFLTKKDRAKSVDGYHRRYFEQALYVKGLDSSAIDKLSIEELQEIYDWYQREVMRYYSKFPLRVNDKVAEASIFTYEGDGKVRVSIPPERMTTEQKEHLELIEKYIGKAFEGVYGDGAETKIIVESDPEAWKINYYQLLTVEYLKRGYRGPDFLGAVVIDRKTGKVVARGGGGD